MVYFQKFITEDVPYAKKRQSFVIREGLKPNHHLSVCIGYLDETKRLYGVLEIRLKDRDWLVGPGAGFYSIADINVFPWCVNNLTLCCISTVRSRKTRRVKRHEFCGIESLDEFPRLKAWLERIDARPAAQAGFAVPKSQ